MTLIKLDTRRIRDWTTFHEVFAEVFGFPSFYGKNMNAWVDCMTYLDDPAAGMSTVQFLKETSPFSSMTLTTWRHGALSNTVRSWSVWPFVNWRRLEHAHAPVLALSFYKSP